MQTSNDWLGILAFDSYSGCDIELDISIAHPWNRDILSEATDEDGVAAAKRQVSKNKKYNSELDVWGNPSNCILLVCEHFGHWGGRQNNFFMSYLSDPEMKMERITLNLKDIGDFSA